MKIKNGILVVILTTIAVGVYAQKDSTRRPMPRGTKTLTPTTLSKPPPPKPSTPDVPTNPQVQSIGPTSPYIPLAPYIPVTPQIPNSSNAPPPQRML